MSEDRKPKIGDIVNYNTSESFQNAMPEMSCNKQTVLPATIVAVWSDTCVNLKVHLDGIAGDAWKTSVTRGTGQCQWNFPE